MKYLDFNIALKSTNPQKQTTRPKVFTNDLDSVMIRVTVTDMTDTDLLGSSAEMLLYMQDRSFFQNTDVTREGNVFKYLLKENEGNHAGIARLQLPVKTADGKTYAQQKLEFEIESGLETKVATEVMIHDWTTLTREARAYIDEFKLLVDDAKEQVQANIVETAVEEKFNNLEAEYAEDLTEVKTHLADRANLKGWELQNKTRKAKPIITFIDDDGQSVVLTKLKPLSETYSFPYTCALFVKAIEETGNNYMDIADVVNLQNTLGWEMSSHTYEHLNLSTLTDEQQEYQMKHSIDVMVSWGLKVSTICYPYDGRNDKTYELARKYFRAARRSYGGVNTIPLETYAMRCVPLGSWFDTQGTNPYPTNSLEYYKYKVDEAIANNSWLIFMTHCGDPSHDATQQSYLEQTIQYIQSLDVDIVTFDEGLNRIGNIVDTGSYFKDNLTKKHFVIGADGTISTSDIQGIVELNMADIYTTATSPSEVGYGKYIITRISNANTDFVNFPESKAGVLITDTTCGYNSGKGYIYQEYHVYSSNNIYKRYSDSNGVWSSWEVINSQMSVLALNSVTNANLYTDFPNKKISHCQISTIGAGTFPEAKAGTLMTNRINGTVGFSWQEYDIYSSGNKYKRYVDASGNWSAWELLNNTVITLVKDSVSNTSDKSAFPIGKISYCTIGGANASGFPTGAGGTLITNALYNSNGYIYQEYHLYNSLSVYKRFAQTTDGTWSAWTKISAV